MSSTMNVIRRTKIFIAATSWVTLQCKAYRKFSYSFFPNSVRRYKGLPALAAPSDSCYFQACTIRIVLWRIPMSTFGLIEYKDASPEVRAVYDDIMATRKIDWINNFWKAIAHDPALLKRTWESLKQIMDPGALDPLTKELIYIAVSVTNNCNYCITSHTASAFGKGMIDAMFKELQAVNGMAKETNELVTSYKGEDDE